MVVEISQSGHQHHPTQQMTGMLEGMSVPMPSMKFMR